MLQSILLSFEECFDGVCCHLEFYHVHGKACWAHGKNCLLRMVLHKKSKYHFNYLFFFFAFSGIYCSVRNFHTCTPSAQLRYIRTPGIAEIYPALRSKKKYKVCTTNTAQSHLLWWLSLFVFLFSWGGGEEWGSGQGMDSVPAWRIMTNSFKKPERKYEKFIPYVVNCCPSRENIFRGRVGKLGTIALAVSSKYCCLNITF